MMHVDLWKEHIKDVMAMYFHYVMLSHVGRECAIAAWHTRQGSV